METLIAIKKVTTIAKYSLCIILPKQKTQEQFGNISEVQIYFTEDCIILKPVKDIGIEMSQEVPQEANVPQAV